MDSNNIIFCFYLKIIIKRVSHKKRRKRKKNFTKKNIINGHFKCKLIKKTTTKNDFIYIYKLEGY